MSDIIFLLLTFFIVFSFGIPISLLFPPTTPARLLIVPVLGYAALTLIVTWLYVFGLSMIITYWLLFIFAFLVASYFFKKNPYLLLPILNNKWGMAIAGMVIISLILPKWAGGANFYIFQGNQWDTFYYLYSALVSSKRSYSYILNLNLNQFLDNPIYSIAHDASVGRPSTQMLYSFFSQINPSGILKLHYTYLIFNLFLSWLSLLFLIRNLFSTNFKKCIVIATAFVLGFWAQYILDIGAWGHISGLPLILLLIAISVLFLTEPVYRNVRFFIVFILILSSSLYMYPEMVIFCFLGFLGMVLYSLKMRIICLKESSLLLFPIAISIIVCMIFYSGVFIHIINITRGTLSKTVNWWLYYLGFLTGQGDLSVFLQEQVKHLVSEQLSKTSVSSDIVKTIISTLLNNPLQILLLGINALASLLGLYFITPITGLNAWQIIIWSILLVLFCLALVFNAFRWGIYCLSNHKQKLTLFLVFLIILTGEILFLIYKKQYWPAGKAISYISPLVLIFLSAPFLVNQKFNFKVLIIIFFLACQIMFGIYRPIAVAMSPSGIHYPPPYPASLLGDAPLAKKNYKWDYDEILNKYQKCSNVEIDVSNIWFRYYLFGVFFLNDKNIYTRNEVRYSFVGDYLGQMKKNFSTGCLITDESLRK
jgi:hypothetical protein